MGFQPADVLPLAHAVLKMPGVSGVWMAVAPDDRGCAMWVAVEGLDDDGYRARMAVRDAVESFLQEHGFDMKFSRFVFDYHVVIEQPELGELQIPPGALKVEAAA